MGGVMAKMHLFVCVCRKTAAWATAHLALGELYSYDEGIKTTSNQRMTPFFFFRNRVFKKTGVVNLE